MQRSRADGTYCVLLKTRAVRRVNVPVFRSVATQPRRCRSVQVFLLQEPLGGCQKMACSTVNFPACAPGGPGCGLLATPQRSARMPPLVPGVPCTMSGCVYPRGNRGVHRDARNRVMPASHPPMPCDPPCLVAWPCLYSAREDRQPRPSCGRAPAHAAGRLVPTARFSPGDRPWPRHPRLDAMPRFPMSR